MWNRIIVSGCVSVFFILFLTSCESLPPGNPPNGTIASFKPLSSDEAINSRTAINTMITAIITSPQISTSKTPPKIKFESPVEPGDKNKFLYFTEFMNLSFKVYRNLLASKLIETATLKSKPDYIFLSRFTKKPVFYEFESEYAFFSWKLSLCKPKNLEQPVWSHTVNLKIKRKEQKPSNKYEK